MSDHPPTGSERPPPPPPGRPTRSDAIDRTPPRRNPQPNYAIRRLGAAATAVAVVIVSIIVIARAFGDDDGQSSAGDVDADWTHVVTLTADGISVIDPGSGDVVDQYPATGSLLDDQSLVSGPMLVTMNDFGRIAITDLTDGSIRRGQAGTDETMIRSRDHRDIALIGADVGGDLTVIDISERAILSIGEIAGLDSPLMFADAARVNQSGTHIAVSDGRSFQTIVVDLAEAAATPLAGQIVAINDRTVVTAQRAGESTELEFYDLVGERLGSVDLPTPVASMLTEDDEVLTVDAQGTVRIAQAMEVNEVGSITRPATPGSEGVPASPTGGIDTANGTRLLVSDGTSTWVLDDEGETLQFDANTITSPVTGFTRCINIGGSFGNTSTIVDVELGQIIGDLDALLVSLTSIDGCTASLLGRGSVLGDEPTIRFDGEPGEGTPVWYERGLVEIVGDSVAAIAPDGSTAAVVDATDTLLVDLGDGSSITLATEPVVVHFADR